MLAGNTNDESSYGHKSQVDPVLPMLPDIQDFSDQEYL